MLLLLHTDELETSSTGKKLAGLVSSMAILNDPLKDSPVEHGKEETRSGEAINCSY